VKNDTNEILGFSDCINICYKVFQNIQNTALFEVQTAFAQFPTLFIISLHARGGLIHPGNSLCKQFGSRSSLTNLLNSRTKSVDFLRKYLTDHDINWSEWLWQYENSVNPDQTPSPISNLSLRCLRSVRNCTAVLKTNPYRIGDGCPNNPQQAFIHIWMYTECNCQHLY